MVQGIKLYKLPNRQ